MKVSKKKAEAILKKIAEDNNTTVEDVTKGGKEITPEMLISYLTDQVGKK